MPKTCSLSKPSSYGREFCERSTADNRKPWRITYVKTCIILTILSLLLFLCGLVDANSYLPALSPDIIAEETCVSIFLTNPTNTFLINVTEYDAQQIVKNATIEFYEPVSYVSFTLNVLSDRPPLKGLPSNESVLQYYTITFLTDLADKIANVTMFFSIKKAALQEGDVEEITLALYRYDGEKIEECPSQKVEEDDAFAYFMTQTDAAAYIAIIRGVVSTNLWIIPLIITGAMLVAVIGIYIYRKSKSI
jgi:PGF-pre-PGF domain-containing protein